jgi:hypothetical protein
MSEIRAKTISDLVGTGPATLTGQHAAKVWSNLNGTGTIAERDSFNISGYVDNGTGDYTFTLTNNMSDANYAATVTAHQSDNIARHIHSAKLEAGARATSSLTIQAVQNETGTGVAFVDDADEVAILSHGDLA